MNLYLVQHGQAKSDAEDPARPLTHEGVKAVERVAAWIAKAGVSVTEIRHSGKKRAEQTAGVFARHLLPVKGLKAHTGLSPKDDVRPLADALKEHRDSIMVVGHLPFLNRLAGLLIAGDPDREVVRFENGGVVCLVGEGVDWRVAWISTPNLLKGTDGSRGV
ncbi:MAG: phosphohistidine phosphatase SixA [Candidatus Latescibacterota bacterium]|nr:MAG: phosphohistidine phosphatase SixA [Candidatus Latescibacterota bacterium]